MHHPPVILALETSAGICSVALWREGVLAEAEDQTPGTQSRTLIPMMEEVLSRANLRYGDCTAIACTLGPGGFTSLRVGLSAARAIASGAGKPLIGVGTLEVMAYSSGIRGDAVASIDAHRGQWYAQRFRLRDLLPEPLGAALLADENALKALSHGAKTAQALPHARDVARLAHARWMQGERIFSAAPIYIREPDAKLPV